MGSRNFRHLTVWQKGMRLSVACYRVTACFPASELHGLTNQIRRSATSIPANLAEGQGRASKKEFLRSITIAQGSLNELQTHLILSRRIGYLKAAHATQLLDACDEIARMLTRLRKSLSTTTKPDKST